VEHQPGQPFLIVAAEPLAALDRSREVLLLWTDSPESDAEPDEPQ
jgi:rod shape-determining protein MreC